MKEYRALIGYFDAAMTMCNINDVQKFTYLKMYLTGGKQKVVLVMALTETNYRDVNCSVRHHSNSRRNHADQNVRKKKMFQTSAQ